jgi:cob(I)alamin adenosyltransferase
MKIYTKTGDSGETGLIGGVRVPKDAVRIEAYGTVDELNAVVGLVRAETPPPQIDQVLAKIQNALFDLGAELATVTSTAKRTSSIHSEQIAELEQAIDAAESQLPPLAQFILPGGVKLAASLHLARTVCRRAERRVIALRSAGESVSSEAIIYLNRLSDLLFVLARLANALAARPDVAWQKYGHPGD